MSKFGGRGLEYRTAYSTLNDASGAELRFSQSFGRRTEPFQSAGDRSTGHSITNYLREEVLSRQKRFAWWGSSGLANANYIPSPAAKNKALSHDVRATRPFVPLMRWLMDFFLFLFLFCPPLPSPCTREYWCRRSTKDVHV